jgi:hypothetical protein
LPSGTRGPEPGELADAMDLNGRSDDDGLCQPIQTPPPAPAHSCPLRLQRLCGSPLPIGLSRPFCASWATSRSSWTASLAATEWSTRRQSPSPGRAKPPRSQTPTPQKPARLPPGNGIAPQRYGIHRLKRGFGPMLMVRIVLIRIVLSGRPASARAWPEPGLTMRSERDLPPKERMGR